MPTRCTDAAQTPSNAPARHQRLTASFASVSLFLAELEAPLRRDLGSDDMADTVLMVLGEALNNVIEHAYCGRSDGQIDLSLKLGPQGVSLEIRDSGQPIIGDLPDGQPALIQGTAIDDLPEGGFGWSMIRMLTRDLNYRRENGQNHLSCRIPPPDAGRLAWDHEA